MKIGLSHFPAVQTASQLLEEQVECLSTGIRQLDSLLKGGFPRGRISEIAGPPSSGKTSVVWTTLTEATRRGEAVAYIDAFDVFDPFSAVLRRMDPGLLLWIRCRGSCAKALVAADIVARSASFGAVVLDLIPADKQPRPSGSKPVTSCSWFRLKKTLEGTRTVLLVLGWTPLTGSAGSLVLNLNRVRTVWRPEHVETNRESLRRPGLFNGLIVKVGVHRGQSRGCVTLCSGL